MPFRLKVPTVTFTSPLLLRPTPTLPAVPTPPQLAAVTPLASTPLALLLKPMAAGRPVVLWLTLP